MDIKYCSTIPTTEEAIERLVLAPELFLDIEGYDLGREGGSMCLIQIFSGRPSDSVYVLDILQVPSTPELLRPLLESEAYTKFIWDPRADSTALHRLGIQMNNVVCLQLAEVALDRQYGQSRYYVHGLSKVLSWTLDRRTAREAVLAKKKGRDILDQDPAVFSRRPLEWDMVVYAANDVYHLPYIKRQLYDSLNPYFKEWVKQKSIERVQSAWDSTKVIRPFTRAPH